MSFYNIVLVEPEIPANTGNISRMCAVSGSALHLVRPLGFSVDDKHLKRAGLDYWQYLDLSYYDSIEEIWHKYAEGRFFYASTKARNCYSEINYRRDDFLVFGKETAGLAESIILPNADKCIRVPMLPHIRSHNLSNTVAIVLYEALRQVNFPGLV
jgi:tRNA (cytidine/uridine-2'-O-)-methyltransferase